MKRTLTLLLILLLSAFSLFADDKDKTDTLTVKAYKKSSSTDAVYDARVIDALTGSLDVIRKNAEVDMSNYVNKFLGSFLTSVSSSEEKAVRNRAIFSFHVGGNYTGTFTVTITFKSLAYWDDKKNDRDEKKYIAAQYWFLKNDFKAYFGNRTQSAKDSNNNTETITINSPTANQSVTVIGDNTQTMELKWTVVGYSTSTDETPKKITQNTWDVEAMVAMILLENDSETYKGYNSAENGVYKAPITITMSIT